MNSKIFKSRKINEVSTFCKTKKIYMKCKKVHRRNPKWLTFCQSDLTYIWILFLLFSVQLITFFLSSLMFNNGLLFMVLHQQIDLFPQERKEWNEKKRNILSTEIKPFFVNKIFLQRNEKRDSIFIWFKIILDWNCDLTYLDDSCDRIFELHFLHELGSWE